MQEHVADVLEAESVTPQQRVEALMGEYFRHARAVSRMLEWSSGAASGAPRRDVPVPVGENLELAGDGLRFVDRTRAASDPASWLLAFQTAIERNVPVADSTLTWIGRHVGVAAPKTSSRRRRSARRFATCCVRGRGSTRDSPRCTTAGCSGGSFPSSSAFTAASFATSTTSTRSTSTRCSRCAISSRCSRRSAGARALRRLDLQEIHEPELLSLALLFHDVGKWKDENHAVESARMAQAMLDRLDVAGDARRTVEFLIEQHLQMSEVAFRRDTEDPDVVRQLANLVGTEEQLKMLCLMTLVDVEAVAPDTLTPWNEELLWRLYVDAYNQLTLAYADELIERDPAKLTVLRGGASGRHHRDELLRFVGGLPRRYLSMFDYRHVRLARTSSRDDVHASSSARTTSGS